MATALHNSLSPLDNTTLSPRRHRHTGILLSTFNTNSPYISSSSTSSATSSSSSHTSLTNTPPSSAPSSRRIRFAPLPDPRRSVVVTEDGRELPLSEDASSFPCPSIPLPQDDNESNGHDTSSLSSSGSASKHNSFADSIPSTPGTMTPISTSPEDEIGTSLSTFSPVPAPKKSSFTKSVLFQRFSKRPSSQSSASSTHSLTPTLTPTSSHDPASSAKGGSNSRKGISTEEILTLGAINLFRASSRDQADGTSGWALQRWTSAGGKDKESEPSWGAPLTRSQSSQSAKAKRPFLSLPSPLSNSSNKPQPRYTTVGGNRTGTRMLNGRIYGGKRRNQPNANPFANARDEIDPEFVEWGYGGMGSVKNGANPSNVWNRLQTDGRGVTVGHATPAADEDDGSGLAWVRRRREERERLQREKVHRENQASDPAQNDEADPEPQADESIPTETDAALPSTHNISTEEHDTRAVSIPAPPRHHHRSNSRRSIDLHPIALEKELAAVAEQKNAVTLKKNEDSEDESDASGTKEDDEDSEDDSDVSSPKDDEDSEDESEEEDDEAGNKMVLGAGVEKISRHKDAATVLGVSARSEDLVEVNAGGGGNGR